MKDNKLIKGIEFGDMGGEVNNNQEYLNYNQPQILIPNQQFSEEDMLNNSSIRNDMLSKVYVLSQIGKLLLLPDQEYTTIELAAKYFNVSVKTIETVIARNYNELIYSGLIIISKENLKRYKQELTLIMKETSESLDNYINKFSPILTLLNKRVILNIAMLLRDSEVAKEIRRMILNSLETPQGNMAFLTTMYYKMCEIQTEFHNFVESQTKEPIDKPIRNSARDRTIPETPEYLQEVFKVKK